MKIIKIKSIVFSAMILLLCNSGSALATIITLNDIPLDFRSQVLPSYNEGGYNIAASCTNCSNVFSTVEANAGYGASTAAVGWGASGRFLETWNTSVVFRVTNIAGNLFHFKSFNMGWFDNDTNNANWNIRAFDSLGNLVANDSYIGRGEFNFNYLYVSSIELQNNGGFSSFDNLNVEVSEPSILAFMGLGIIGIAFTKRYKK
mmetsp:Transcript_34675/g.109506  ORF Transcript_34675/g.109506 Transcript_34675/m.109506 type:complete len:203 (-) Transcript_34675:32-640(-)